MVTKYPEIEEFVRGKKSARSVKYKLYDFFEFVQQSPKDYFKTANIDEDILRYIDSIKNLSPGTRKNAVSVLRTFFMFNNRRFEPRTDYLLKERTKGSSSITKRKVMTRAILKEILSNGDVFHRALFLTMASSGMRANEAISITLNDIYLDETPARVQINPGISKTNSSYVTFVSVEAKFYILRWLKIRQKYLDGGRHQTPKDDKRLFPIRYDVLYEMWLGLLNKSGYTEKDEKTGWFLLTPHTLRKFFKSQLLDSNIPFEVYESFIGHTEGIRATYRAMTDEQLRKWYIQGEPNLLVFELPANQEVIEDIKAKMDKLQGQVEELIQHSPFYKQQIIDPIDNKPIIPPEKAVEEYTKHQQNQEEIEDDGLELWGIKARSKRKKDKSNV